MLLKKIYKRECVQSFWWELRISTGIFSWTPQTRVKRQLIWNIVYDRCGGLAVLGDVYKTKSMMCAIGLIAKRNYSKNILTKVCRLNCVPIKKILIRCPVFYSWQNIISIHRNDKVRWINSNGIWRGVSGSNSQTREYERRKRAQMALKLWLPSKALVRGEECRLWSIWINSILHFQFSKSITENIIRQVCSGIKL